MRNFEMQPQFNPAEHDDKQDLDQSESESADVSQLSADEMIDLVGEWGKFLALPDEQKKIMAERLLKEQPDAVLSVTELSDTLSAEQKFQLAAKIADDDPWSLLRSTDLIQSLDAAQRSSLIDLMGDRVTAEQLSSSGLLAESSGEQAGPESKEQERGEMQSLELRDVNGALIGTAELEWGEAGPDYEGFKRLQAFSLRGEHNGQETDLNVFELANPRDIPVLVSQTDQRAESIFNFKKDEVVVGGLDNHFDVAVLLHELGHASQSQEDEYAKWNDLYTEKHQVSFVDSPQDIQGLYDKVVAVESDLQDAVNPAEVMREIKANRSKWYANRETIGGLAKEITEIKYDLGKAEGMIKAFDQGYADVAPADRPAKYHENVRRFEELSGQLQEKAQELQHLEEKNQEMELQLEQTAEQSGVAQLGYMGSTILERDATKRALLWIRRIKQESGVNLLAQGSREQASKVGDGEHGCGKSMLQGTADPDSQSDSLSPLDVLRANLASHQADRPARRGIK